MEGEVIFLPMLDVVALQAVTAAKEICSSQSIRLSAPAVRAEGSVLSSPTSQAATLVTRSSESFKLHPEQLCWLQGCPQDAQTALGRHCEQQAQVLSPLILQPEGQLLLRVTSHVLISPPSLDIHPLKN